jgi:cell division protein FtsZ
VKQEKVEKVDLEDFKIVKRDVFENQSYTPKETFEPKNIIQSQSIPENTPLDEFTVRVIDNESINDVSSNSNYNEEIEEIVTFKMPNSLMSDDTVSEKKEEPVQENYSYGNNNSFVEDDNKAYEKSLEENIKLRHHERMSKLRDMSLKIRTASGLAEIESEPAYLRKNVVLSNVTHSSETDISKYSLGQDDENKSELKSNSYLHDNVD